jgi:excisionase family DNA binding protein
MRTASRGPAPLGSPGSDGDPQERAKIQPFDHHLESATPEACSQPRAGDRLVFSVAEAGELLGLSRAFAYELVARGELPVIRFGRRIVVPKAALLELLGAVSSSTT